MLNNSNYLLLDEKESPRKHILKLFFFFFPCFKFYMGTLICNDALHSNLQFLLKFNVWFTTHNHLCQVEYSPIWGGITHTCNKIGVQNQGRTYNHCRYCRWCSATTLDNKFILNRCINNLWPTLEIHKEPP